MCFKKNNMEVSNKFLGVLLFYFPSTIPSSQTPPPTLNLILTYGIPNGFHNFVTKHTYSIITINATLTQPSPPPNKLNYLFPESGDKYTFPSST